jgi:sugar phosphate permease
LLYFGTDINWRVIFWVCGGLILIICAIIYIPLKSDPSEVGLTPPEDEEEEEDKPEPNYLDNLSSFQAMIEFFKSPRFWLIILIQVFDGPFINIPADWYDHH